MKQVMKLLLFSILMIHECVIFAATTFGSTANNQTRFATTLQAFGAGASSILGYASLDAGFSISTAASTVTYNAVGDINGPITLTGGTLILDNDFIMQSNASFATSGNITGNSFMVSLPHLAFTLSSAFNITTATVVANSYFSVSAALRFLSTNNVLDGNNNVVDVTGGTLSVGAGGSLLIKNAMIKGADAGKIFCEDSLASLTLQNVTWIQDSSYSFTQGILDILNDVTITGSAIFAYTSTRTLTIHSNSTLFFDTGMTFSYSPANNGLLNFTDATAALHFNQATLFADTSGLSLKKGTAIFNGPCPIISQGTTSAKGILIGDNSTTANNFLIQVAAETGLNVQSGFFVYQNV